MPTEPSVTLGSVGISNPVRAHALAPWDGRITARLAERRFFDAQATKSLADMQLAQWALRQDPTAVPAVTTLALRAQLGGDVERARRLFRYAQALSRRDLTTQLWAIEDAVAHNDIEGALRHYDTALRATSPASNVLFPILVDAIADPHIRFSLTRTLAARPSWGPLFIEYASLNGADPRSTALLFLGLSRNGYPVSELARQLLISRLVSGGLFEDAWAYYASLQNVGTRRRSRDANFTANLVNPTVFDWQVVPAEGLNSSLQPGLFEFSAPSNVGGVLVQQLQMLPAGAYDLVGHSVAIDQHEDSSPYWVLTCRDGQELGRVVVPDSARANGNFAGRINVPASCPVQTLALVARPSTAISGLAGQFDHVELAPVG
jgi:hypothetical protein